ncbi:MAG: acetolactate synthase 2 small subunit [Proteobacteria bacterium]|nr:acetolactate synthase 2 small subunit [Pseudomonadota bacterium]
MNHSTLIIKANNQPTVMERLMQVTRYRGFSINKLNMQKLSDKDLEIIMSVDSRNPIENLSRQLLKLVDVVDISISNS